jgi:hypothetical protein
MNQETFEKILCPYCGCDARENFSILRLAIEGREKILLDKKTQWYAYGTFFVVKCSCCNKFISFAPCDLNQLEVRDCNANILNLKNDR